MLNIFKKKNYNNESVERDIEMIKLMDEHLNLIRDLGKRVKRLEDNAALVGELVIDQQKAMKDLEESVKQLQELTNKN